MTWRPSDVDDKARAYLDVDDKARAYLGDGKIIIVSASPGHVDALAFGSAPFPYAVSYLDGDGWRCTCPARTECAHIRGARLVTRPEGGS